MAMASTRMKSRVILGPNRLVDNYVPKALYLKGLYYNEQVLKFSIYRWIFKCHLHTFRMWMNTTSRRWIVFLYVHRFERYYI
jgi:hypothetical protein